MSAIIPTIGCKLYFQPNGSDPSVQKYDGQPIDATVVYVWPKAHDGHPYLLNLLVVDHGGVVQVKNSVPLVQDGDAPPSVGYYAEWMPFQKGQAKAAEVPNVAAGSASQAVPPSGPTESVTSASSAESTAAPLPNDQAPTPDSGLQSPLLSEPQQPITSEATPTSTNGDFGSALVALKAGSKVSRAGWNGKGMFVYLVPAASYPAQTGAAKSFFGEGAMVPYNAYLAIKNVDNTVSTWVPSVNDVLADDWSVL